MSSKETNQTFKLPKEELFENEEFLELVKSYNALQKKLKKPEKTLDELYEICFEKWVKADLSDDLLFGMFCDDLEVSERLINLFLKSKNVEIGSIKKIERQKVIDLGFDIRGVRFDVFFEGSDKVVNVEMQTGTKLDLELRIRFYQAILDMHLLPKGGKKNYSTLPETFIIFICTDVDPIGEGELEHLINPYAHIKKDNSYKLFNTKANWIIYNASAYKDFDESREDYNEELKSFFAFLKNDPLDNEFTEYMSKHFIKIKANIEMGRNFMLTMVRDLDKYNEGYDECYQECYQEKIQMVLTMIDKNLDYELIQELSKLSIEEIENIRENHLNTSL